MQNILIVFTGGTIGSTSMDGRINISQQQYKIVALYKQRYVNNVDIKFTTCQPLHILSENLFPSLWQDLINAIEAEGIEQYDGIIVTHGTDTLAFTAAALGLYFNQIQIPLLLVSSDMPLESVHANGVDNFNCAVEFILQRRQAGIFVPYKNAGADTHVHIGTRLASSLQLSGDFVSVQSKAYLQFSEQQFQLKNKIDRNNIVSKTVSPHFVSKILLIKPYPGLDYSHFSLEGINAVMHDLYHSGTACSTEEWGGDYSLACFIKKCKKKGVPIYIAPVIKAESMYESTNVLIDCGARVIWNMSLEAAYVKLLLAYGNFANEDVIHQFLEQNIAFEIIS